MNRTLVVIVMGILFLCLIGSIAANGVLLFGVFRTSRAASAAQQQIATQEAQIGDLQAQNKSQEQQIDTLRQGANAAPTKQATIPAGITATAAPTAKVATPAPAGTGSVDSALIKTIEQDVISLRGLEPKSTVTQTLLTEEQLRQRVEQDFEKDYTPEDAQHEAITLTALDFLSDPSTDLRKLYIDLYSEQIAGFYDPKVKQLFVVSNQSELTPLGQTVVAHELDHALQDQYFDLEKMGLDSKGDSEKSLAIRALAEGDAVLLQREYALGKLTPQQLLDLQQEANQQNSTQLDEAPKLIRDVLLFPYTDGLNFVEDAYNRGGWQAVNQVWQHPPASTEEILHPDQYRAGDVPKIVAVAPLTETLGSGWHMTDSDQLGELATRSYLSNHLKDDQAVQAAAGWGGDQYAAYFQDQTKQMVFVLRTTWDTNGDATEFVNTYKQYAAARPNASEQKVSNTRTCWTGKDRLCLSWTASETLVTLGPDQATVDKVLGQFPDFK